MPETKANGQTVAIQLMILVAVFLFFLYILGYSSQLFPSSLGAQVAVIIVVGEIVLVEFLYFRSFYRRRVSMRVTEETITRVPLRDRVFTYNNFILLSVYTFILFITAIAYVLTLPPLTGQVIYNVVGTLVTVQGLLLGLLSISTIPLANKPHRLKGLVASTISSILVSVATIMTGQVSTPIPQYVLTGLFLVSVAGFSIVVGVYSWLIIETRTAPSLEKS